MDPKVVTLYSRAGTLLAEFRDGNGSTDCIDEAIALYREAVELCPLGHPSRYRALYELATGLFARFKRLGGMEDLNEGITLARDSLRLMSSEHDDRPVYLMTLAVNLSIRRQTLGRVQIEDRDEAIALASEAVSLCPPGHPRRPTALNDYASHLFVRYTEGGGMEELDEVIAFIREGLELCELGDPSRRGTLNNIALFLADRHEQLGGMMDLSEAIIFSREALVLSPVGYVERPSFLSNLARYLYTRYERLDVSEDLDEAIVHEGEALALRPQGHPDRWVSLTNLAGYLCDRYKELGTVEDLNEAIDLALQDLPPSRPDRPGPLMGLAKILSCRYQACGEMENLNKAIDLDREALTLMSSGHPKHIKFLGSLESHLSIRYDHTKEIDDLDEAIRLDRDTMAILPLNHPSRPNFLKDSAERLSTRFRQTGQLEDREEIFNRYAELAHVTRTASASDLSAATAWVCAAEEFQHPTALLAYETALRFLDRHLTNLPSPSHHLNVLGKLTSSLGVGVFSAGLRNGSPVHAVELLERGRGVVLSQLARLRSSLNNAIASDPAGEALAEEFTQLSSAIRDALVSPDEDRHDQLCHLGTKLQRVVDNIRDLPGLSHFLSPLPFSDLQQAASGGPVIIVNASERGCDALVVFSDRDPVHIPLQITEERAQELSSTFNTLTARAEKVDVTEELVSFLRQLWDEVVSPIATFFQATLALPLESRVWWCPTAAFSLLPLHAAGPYKEDQQNFSDLYISSYTPTLTALLHARRPSPSNATSDKKRFIAIGQARAGESGEGGSPGPSVGAELDDVGRRVVEHATFTFTRIEGTESTIARVGAELDEHCEWVHIACDVVPSPDSDPGPEESLESAFVLHGDDRLTIARLLRCTPETPEFVYLSAGRTATAIRTGDDDDEEVVVLPDEAIHFASVMLFVGFRSVIGTMGPVVGVGGDEARKITPVFYENMLAVGEEGGCHGLDHARAALALHETMKRLADIPLVLRASYVHLGV